MNLNEIYIKRCIEIAKKGIGNVAPNPLVGSVIVYDNKIIGEGYHRKYGGAHAEVNAINSVKDKELLKKSTLYVNLEPCSHYGKTPPCADLIIEKGIPNVVIGNVDSFHKVAGTGIEKLKNAGIEVIHGVLNEECLELNKRFFKFNDKKRPYIILKWAQTLDGFIDKTRDKLQHPQPTWISNENAKILVHKWRSEEQAILVGSTTVTNDNPKLTVREWNGKNPDRIVIDPDLILNLNLNIFDDSAFTYVINKTKRNQYGNIEYICIDFNKNIASQICNFLYSINIQSVIIEGGKQTLETFIKENLWDESRIFYADKMFFEGVKCPEINGDIVSNDIISGNKLIVLKNNN